MFTLLFSYKELLSRSRGYSSLQLSYSKYIPRHLSPSSSTKEKNPNIFHDAQALLSIPIQGHAAWTKQRTSRCQNKTKALTAFQGPSCARWWDTLTRCHCSLLLSVRFMAEHTHKYINHGV